MSKISLKKVKVTNRSNVIVQIPKWVVDAWGLQNDDYVDILFDTELHTIVVTPRKEETAIERPNSERNGGMLY